MPFLKTLVGSSYSILYYFFCLSSTLKLRRELLERTFDEPRKSALGTVVLHTIISRIGIVFDEVLVAVVLVFTKGTGCTVLVAPKPLGVYPAYPAKSFGFEWREVQIRGALSSQCCCWQGLRAPMAGAYPAHTREQ